MANLTDDEFKFLRELQLAEQTYYWNRFTAFAAINSGLLVVLATSGFHPVIKMAGLITSLFWLFVQWKSRRYVESQKNEFWNEAEVRGHKRRQSDGTISVTMAGVSFTAFVALFWSATFFFI